MNDWFKPCEHGYAQAHPLGSVVIGQTRFPSAESCPGGSPVTAADLEGLGERFWFCVIEQRYHLNGRPWFCHPNDSECGERLLIPIPDPVADYHAYQRANEAPIGYSGPDPQPAARQLCPGGGTYTRLPQSSLRGLRASCSVCGEQIRVERSYRLAHHFDPQPATEGT